MKKITSILILILNFSSIKAEELKETNPSSSILNIVENIFIKENPVFLDKKHLLMLNSGISFHVSKLTNLYTLQFAYSIPTKLFWNGRTSLYGGAILGSTSYSGFNGNVNHFLIGIMHEFLLNFEYFYLGVGVGLVIRNSSTRQNSNDPIGSELTLNPKFTIGKTFGDRYNIEGFYSHFSNGGITSVNSGYDFIGLGFGVRF